MNTTHTTYIRRICSCCWLLLLSIVINDGSAVARGSLFQPPKSPRDADEILLISTRGIGTACDSKSMQQGLECQKLVSNPTRTRWEKADWRRVLSPTDKRPTIIYVHGNRVGPGKDREQGLQIYRSLRAQGNLKESVRFVIWSWPATQIPGPIKDYVLKAKRTNPVAWQLAWLMDKMPVDTQISLVGYSYGSRVVSGAVHLLGGGALAKLKLTERTHPDRPPVRAALIAAAFDADWIQPGNFYGRSVAKFEQLVFTTNQLDPAMRFYHLSNGRGKMHALGKAGVYQPRALGELASRLRKVDFANAVGRSHDIVDYLAAREKMSMLWHQIMPSSQATVAYHPRPVRLDSLPQ